MEKLKAAICDVRKKYQNIIFLTISLILLQIITIDIFFVIYKVADTKFPAKLQILVELFPSAMYSIEYLRAIVSGDGMMLGTVKLAETYLEPSRTSTMKFFFAKIANY